MLSQKNVSMFLCCVCFSFGTLFVQAQKTQKPPKPVIIGYVGGYNGNIVNTNAIDAKKMTHINYAFVNIKDNRAWLEN